MSDADRVALVKQLKADQASRKQQLTSLVHKMMSGQAKTYGQAMDMWKFLTGNGRLGTRITELSVKIPLMQSFNSQTSLSK